MVQVYKERVSVGYHAPLFSCASLFSLGCLVALLLVPFFLAYDPYTFWLKTDTYREQPGVEDLHTVVIQLDGLDASGKPFAAFFSSAGELNAGVDGRALRMATVMSRGEDSNDDGLADLYEIKVRVPLEEGERVYSARAMAFFALTLQERAKLQTDAVLFTEQHSGVPGRSLSVQGSLQVSQTWPLALTTNFQKPDVDSPLLKKAAAGPPGSFFTNVVQESGGRNVTLQFYDVTKMWEPLSVLRTLQEVYFDLTLTARIHQQDILYTPPVSEVTQAGWVEYLSVLVVVWFLLDRLSAFVFSNQLLETRVGGTISKKSVR